MPNIFITLKELSPVGFGLRAVVVGIMLYFVSRKLPRRSAGQYAGFDFTFFWMMGGLIASPLYDPKINFINTITAVVTVFLWHHAIAYFALKSRPFARIVYGTAVPLIRGGKIIRGNMKRELFNLELLLTQLRLQKVGSLAEVEEATLETNGEVSIIKKPHLLPVTPKDLNIPVVSGGGATIVVDDGKVLVDNLTKLNHSEKWLKEQLRKEGIIQVKDVYLAVIDSMGKLSYSVK
ncbi:MAG: DUF421 domain-containing protein [Firmicutes bacterium HGW-Firmicutes-8]|nr:MAG: DUF421 domain-containing protein [Firmicutes bacterium HGW-Firmicutes-8]